MWKQEIIVENPKDVADTIYRLAEAINELPFGAEKERKKLGETIVNLCKLLDVDYKWKKEDT